jgi:predicted small lipoprotein YifL
MKTNIKSLVIALSTLALCGTAGARPLVVRPAAHAPQPEMNQAIVQLEAAKKAHHPIEHLERAKHDLEEARHNKGGERVEAIKQVNEAIGAARHKNHKAMHEHIERAIHEVREGERFARRH